MLEQMLTDVVDRGQKLFSADRSCIVDRERKYSRMLKSRFRTSENAT